MDDGQNFKKHYIEILLIAILILYSVNFNGIGFLIMMIFLPIYIIYSWKQYFNKTYLISLFILVLFGVTFSLSVYSFGLMVINTIIATVVFPIVLYGVGYMIGETDTYYTKSYKTIFILFVLLNIFILLSYVKTISVFGSLEGAKSIYQERALIDVWGKDSIKATVVTVYLSFSLAVFPAFFIKNPKIKKGKILLLKTIIMFCALSSFYITAQMASRTSIIIIGLSSLMIYLFLHGFSLKKIIIPIITLLGIILMWVLFQSNIFGIKTWWSQTSVYNRFQSSGLESSRYDAWKEVIKNMFNYPLGGRKIDISISYAHNLWLDVVYDAGVLPFILLIAFTLIAAFSLVRFIRLDFPVFLKALLISIYVAFFTIFMTEPILATKERFYFTVFCLIVGVTQGLNMNFQKRKFNLKK